MCVHVPIPFVEVMLGRRNWSVNPLYAFVRNYFWLTPDANHAFNALNISRGKNDSPCEI